MLTACGSGGDTSDAPQISEAQLPSSPPSTQLSVQSDIVEFDRNNLQSFDYQQHALGHPVSTKTVLSESFANVSGIINYPPNNSSQQGNLTVSVSVQDADGIKNVFIGFDGTEQNILSACSSSCGSAFSQTITGINPLLFGVSESGTLQLQLWVEDDLGNRVFSQNKTINWQPVNLNGVSASRTQGNLNISWNRITNYLRYNVYVSSNPELSLFNYSTVTLQHRALAITNNTLTISSLEDETPYYILVTGVDGGGESAFSSTLPIDPLSGPLNQAPIALADEFELLEDETFSASLINNDSDPDNEPVIINTTALVTVKNGNLTLNEDGTFNYTPPSNFFGVEQFSYQIRDEAGLTAEALVTLNIQPVNDPPQALDNSYNVSQADEALSISAPGLLANDADVDFNDIIEVRVDTEPVTAPQAGELTLQSNGAFEYRPEPDFSGEVSFQYRIIDGDNAESIALTTISIGAENTPPTAVNDSYVIAENASLDTQQDNKAAITDNDTDSDSNDTINLSEVRSTPANGQLTTFDNGHFRYIPNPNFYGVDSFVYRIIDSQSASADAVVTIVVVPQNNPPVAVNDSYQFDEDSVLTINAELGVLANDTDSDGDPLRIAQIDSQPSHGTLQMQNDGSFSYTPETDFFGTDSFSYSVTDGRLFEDSATVALQINNVNDNPQANNDTASTKINDSVTIDVLSNDSDVDGDTLTVQSAQAQNGNTLIGNNLITYTPTEGFSGNDTISYSIADGNGGTDSATVAVVIDDNLNNPIAEPDSYVINEDSELIATAGSESSPGLLDNDSDADGDTLTVVGFVTQPEHGEISIADSGSFVYRPNSHFFGSDSFIYQVSDGHGGTANGNVTITVNGINDAPTANDDIYTITQDQEAIFEVLQNDIDVDNNQLVITGAHGGAGEITIIEGRSIRYRPPSGFIGDDFFEYNISDDNGGTSFANVNITIKGPNRPPNAQNDSASTAEDQLVTIDILANDSDPDGDPLFITSIVASHGQVSLNNSNQVTYLPDANYHGRDTIEYTIADSQGETDSAIVDVTIAPVNDLPQANNDIVTVFSNTTSQINPLSNDSDADGDSLRIAAVSAEHGSVTVVEDTLLRYTSAQDFTGLDTITYTISDGNEGTATAIIAVTVSEDTRENHPPVANNDIAQMLEDSQLNINVLANDSDIDGDTLTVIRAQSLQGETTINSDQTINFRPLADFFGNAIIEYTISDGRGGEARARVDLSVEGQNDTPIARNDSAEVSSGQTATINVLANDTDVDGDRLRIVEANADKGEVSIHDEVELIYTAPSNVSGSAQINYTIDDGHGGRSTARVDVTIKVFIPAVDANDDTANTDEDTLVTINVLDNDTGGDSSNPLKVISATAQHGTAVINNNNSITYTPASNYNGRAIIDYTIGDGNTTDSAKVTVTVNPINDPPILIADTISTNEDTAVSINVLANDNEVDGEMLDIVSATVDIGSVEIDNDDALVTHQRLIYTPPANYSGTAIIAYTVTDGTDHPNNSASTIVTVSINAVNDAPELSDISVQISESAENGTEVLTLTAVDADDQEQLTFAITNGNQDSTFAIDGGNGKITVADNSQLSHENTPTYLLAVVVTDSGGLSDSATVTINVAAQVSNVFPIADSSFGNIDDEAGIAGTNAFAFDNNDSPQAMKIDSQGRMLVVGNVGGNDIFIARYKTDGSIDQSFARLGRNVISFGGTESASGIDIDASGNIYITGEFNNGSTTEAFLVKLEADGEFNTGFGTSGFVFSTIGQSQLFVSDIIAHSDGTLLIGTSINDNFAVLRYSADGQFETMALFDVPGSFDTLEDMHEQPDGKVILAGHSANSGTFLYDFAVARINVSGSSLELDNTFNESGTNTFDLGQDQTDMINAIGLQSGQHIVLAGSIQQGSSIDDVAVAVLTPSGVLDSSFGDGGIAIFDADSDVSSNNSSFARSVAVDANDNLYFALQFSQSGSIQDLGMLKTSANGTPDSSYGNNGVVDIITDENNNVMVGAVLDSDNRPLVVSTAQGPRNQDIAFGRLTTSGLLDTTFLRLGYSQDNMSQSDDSLYVGLELKIAEHSGKFLLAGYTHSNDNSFADLIVTRHNADGTIDGKFGINGYFYHYADTSSTSGSGFYTYDATELTDGRVVLAGLADNQPFLLMLTTMGTLDTSFGDNGLIKVTPSGFFGTFQAVRQDNSGRIVAGGYQFSSTTDLYLARYDSNGNLDTSFNNTGELIVDLDQAQSKYEAVNRIAILPDNSIIVIGYHDNQSMVTKVLSNGSLDTSGFNSPAGFVVVDSDPDSTSHFDYLEDLEVTSDGTIYASGQQSASPDFRHVVLSVNPDGTMNNNFDSDGLAVFNFGHGDAPQSIALDTNGNLLLAGTVANATEGGNDVYLARITPSGVADTNFNNGSAVNISYSLYDNARWVHAMSDGRIIVAGNNRPDNIEKKIWYMLMLKLVDPCAEPLVTNNAGLSFDQQLYQAQLRCR